MRTVSLVVRKIILENCEEKEGEGECRGGWLDFNSIDFTIQPARAFEIMEWGEQIGQTIVNEMAFFVSQNEWVWFVFFFSFSSELNWNEIKLRSFSFYFLFFGCEKHVSQLETRKIIAKRIQAIILVEFWNRVEKKHTQKERTMVFLCDLSIFSAFRICFACVEASLPPFGW